MASKEATTKRPPWRCMYGTHLLTWSFDHINNYLDMFTIDPRFPVSIIFLLVTCSTLMAPSKFILNVRSKTSWGQSTAGRYCFTTSAALLTTPSIVSNCSSTFLVLSQSPISACIVWILLDSLARESSVSFVLLSAKTSPPHLKCVQRRRH